MGEPREHAEMSAKRFGGKPEDYIAIHELMDGSGLIHPDVRHRFVTHNTFFVKFILPKIFGETVTNSDGEKVSVVRIGEWHLLEDFRGSKPSLQDWASEIDFQRWMNNGEGGERPPSHKGLPLVDEDELYMRKKSQGRSVEASGDVDFSPRGCEGAPEGMID